VPVSTVTVRAAALAAVLLFFGPARASYAPKTPPAMAAARTALSATEGRRRAKRADMATLSLPPPAGHSAATVEELRKRLASGGPVAIAETGHLGAVATVRHGTPPPGVVAGTVDVDPPAVLPPAGLDPGPIGAGRGAQQRRDGRRADVPRE